MRGKTPANELQLYTWYQCSIFFARRCVWLYMYILNLYLKGQLFKKTIRCVMFLCFVHAIICRDKWLCLERTVLCNASGVYQLVWINWLLPTVASLAVRHWGTCPPRLPTISFLVHFEVNLRANYPNIAYRVVCEISWCTYQQLTAFSISAALVTKLLVIKPLLHPALKSVAIAPWPYFQLCRSS